MTSKKRFVVFSILVFTLIVGLVFFGTRKAGVYKGSECRLESRPTQDNQPEKTELLKLIEAVGKKSSCMNPGYSN